MLDVINRRYYDDATRMRNGVESEETKGSLIMRIVHFQLSWGYESYVRSGRGG